MRMDGIQFFILFTLGAICSASNPQLNTDSTTWEGWFNSQLLWASQEPWTFLSYVLVFLSPCFCVSAVLSWKLGKQIEQQQKKNLKSN